MKRFNVYLKGHRLDSVFYADNSTTKAQAYADLTENHGYNKNIIICNSRSKREGDKK